MRFNELKRNLKDISNTVLSDRLSELEREGLIAKKIYPQVPIKVEYRLTTKAKDLEAILQSLSRWCEKWELKNKKFNQKTNIQSVTIKKYYN